MHSPRAQARQNHVYMKLEVQHGLSAVISPKKKRKLLNKPYSKGKKDEQASIHMHVYSYLSITPHCLFQLTTDQRYFCQQTQHLYISILASPTSAKGSPSYTLLVMDTYSRASTWPLPPLLPASTHAVPTRCSEKAKGKETVMYRLSPPHCLSHKGQEHRTQPRLLQQREVHIEAALFRLLQQQQSQY